jgi:hypothetical protein
MEKLKKGILAIDGPLSDDMMPGANHHSVVSLYYGWGAGRRNSKCASRLCHIMALPPLHLTEERESIRVSGDFTINC